MKKYLNKVLIIDGSYCLHRALHTPALQELSTSTGVKSGGVFGFLRILQAELRKNASYFPVVCWDQGLAKRRTELYPDYKANRHRLAADQLITAGVVAPEDEYLIEYRRQRADIIELLKYIGIPSLLISGWEGDDLIYLVSKSTDDGIVLSDDRDMIQLVSPTIRIRRPMADQMITWEESDESYRHPHFTITKSIVGDSSDNIPQVAAGLGSKGASQIASIIDKCESFDEYKPKLEQYVEEFQKGALVNKVKKLLENWDQFIINYNLINLRLVDPPEGFEMMIKDLIEGVAGKSNLLKAYPITGKYELASIDISQMVWLTAASASQVLVK